MAIDKRYVVNLQGKDYATYPGILSEAHRRGLGSIETQLIQAPTDENSHVAIVKAIVKMYPGLGGEEFSDRPPPFRTFEAYGDASPTNVKSPAVRTALIRMAETRAKGRALRDAIDCGETMLEELPDEPEPAPRAQPARARVAEHMERAERPIPIETPAEPGFEPVYESDGRRWQRSDLIGAALRAQEQALKEGIKVEAIVPHQTTNAELVAWGKRVRPLLTPAKAKEEVTA